MTSATERERTSLSSTAGRKEDSSAFSAGGRLVAMKADLIVALSPAADEAAKQATATIPIVMAATADPVGSGFIASLARPGGNITGLAVISLGLIAKRLELLREAMPRASRVAVLWSRHPHQPNTWCRSWRRPAANSGSGYMSSKSSVPKTRPRLRQM